MDINLLLLKEYLLIFGNTKSLRCKVLLYELDIYTNTIPYHSHKNMQIQNALKHTRHLYHQVYLPLH